MNIPLATYVQAMRVATKYSMDDVQVAITNVIQRMHAGRGITKAIALLALVAEFPDSLPGNFAIQMFINACSITQHPTADDLKPLFAFPGFLAIMMQYREGRANPNNAKWVHTPTNYADLKWEAVDPLLNGGGRWLVAKFRSLGINP